MLLVATRDDILRRRVAHALQRPLAWARTLNEALRHVDQTPTTAVLLDVRLGGNLGRAVDHVPDLLAVSPHSKVTILTRRPTPAEIGEACGLGVYAWADFEADNFEERLRRITYVVTARHQRIAVDRESLPQAQLPALRPVLLRRGRSR